MTAHRPVVRVAMEVLPMIVKLEEYKKARSEKYFMAICQEKKNAWYRLYFVNNSHDTIEVLISIASGAMTGIVPVARMADIDDKIFDSYCAKKFIDVPPKSHAPITVYQDWDFDWSNAQDILLKSKANNSARVAGRYPIFAI